MSGGTASEDTPSQREFLAVFRAEYIKADAFCREVEDFIDEAGIPGFNELRYAGHHLLLALDDLGQLRSPEQLLSATNHAKRACYEAGEAGALIALSEIRRFREDYRLINVSSAIPDYAALMAEAEAQRILMLDPRTTDDDKARDYEIRMTSFRRLRQISTTMEVSRSNCNSLVEEQISSSRRFYIGLWITVIGIIVAAAVAIYTAK